MKTTNTLFQTSSNILTVSEMLMVKGGLAENDKDKKDKKDKKKDDGDYQTIDTEFDFWPEPED